MSDWEVGRGGALVVCAETLLARRRPYCRRVQPLSVRVILKRLRWTLSNLNEHVSEFALVPLRSIHEGASGPLVALGSDIFASPFGHIFLQSIMLVPVASIFSLSSGELKQRE